MELSHRVQAIKESPTLAITAKAQKLRAEGRDVIALAAGEPDFDTPNHIKAAAIAAIEAGFTKYTPVSGTPGLKNAIIAKFKRDQGLDYTARQILVSCGGKQSFYNLCQALLNPGDEVIIPAPYWVSYPDMVLLAEGKPVIVECGIEQGYKLSPTQLAAAITPRTKLVVLNSPSNPTGAVYTLKELSVLGEVLKKHPNVLIASDDMYEHVMLGSTTFTNILNACPDLYPQTMLLNGVSKAYSMTGWRIGYAAGPEFLIKAMENIQSQSTSNPSSISQVAAEAALNGPQAECFAPMLQAFNERHEFVVTKFNAIRGLTCLKSGGAFYAFVDAREAIQNLHREGKLAAPTDLALGSYLLEAQDVAVVPGSAFGAEGYFRISFATSMANLEKALSRIEAALN
ncbi:pyridoxal phosphate-dependent aminotransferase [Chitinimonas sp. BJB300]|uniref:pyridoxal phosphate-dependent aminotransferase n=1 Tax=Chitinimonas sp. BJB300 TaxID=1559339 RepID=UPI000C0D2D4F|nr:pyridoxal phosphate-dependent aminotransferase [Chitinimonas sp. BJB300]PHV10913.1 aspartate aminotransferase [Chitinimonas sp. BJB300]TSJ89955.1 pyridoxal phosphate-dependent aminotransferase [Chitinimonas sp. BJB300]